MSKEALKLALEALDDLSRYADLCELLLKETHPAKAFALRERVTNSIKTITAIKEALAQPEQELVEWKNAAIRLGEELSSVGPDGYYDMTAEQWLDWAIEQRPQGKNSLPPQRTWVGLTPDEIRGISLASGESLFSAIMFTHDKLKDKNNG